MSIATYNKLKNSVIAWSKRTDLDDLIIEDIVKLTETKIDSSDLRLASDEDTESTTLATNDNYVSLPPRFKAIRSIRLEVGQGRYHLKYVTPARLEVNTTPGRPSCYTVTNTIEFDRTPDQSYKIYIDHHQTLLALDPADDSSTNTILTKYPLIYLYGCLEEVFSYILDEQRASAYRNKFYQSILMANTQENIGRFPPDAGPESPGMIA